ncbi:MAG: hypothetical protein IBX64_12575, partial [Actinobacteria bacterium]|nr:hypothetical protein [Actinomycetota bacterium]
LKVFSIQESGREPERALESIDKELEDKTITGWERTPRLHEREKMLKFKESIAHLKDSDVVIGLTHYPLSPRWFSASYSPDYIRLNYDLVLAGHYHGGQIRVPIYGALYIPEYSLSRHGYLPPQDKVRGLTTVGGVKQYISGGLGATGAVSPLRFRLFNTPELNVIKLTKER